MKIRTAIRCAAIFAGVVGLSAAGVTAAQAFPSDCSSNWVCVYDNANYGSQLGWRAAGFALQNVSTPNNDRMSSWSNHSNTNACWYTDANGTGSAINMPAQSQNGYVGATLNDTMSSWKGASC